MPSLTQYSVDSYQNNSLLARNIMIRSNLISKPTVFNQQHSIVKKKQESD